MQGWQAVLGCVRTAGGPAEREPEEEVLRLARRGADGAAEDPLALRGRDRSRSLELPGGGCFLRPDPENAYS